MYGCGGKMGDKGRCQTAFFRTKSISLYFAADHKDPPRQRPPGQKVGVQIYVITLSNCCINRRLYCNKSWNRSARKTTKWLRNCLPWKDTREESNRRRKQTNLGENNKGVNNNCNCCPYFPSRTMIFKSRMGIGVVVVVVVLHIAAVRRFVAMKVFFCPQRNTFRRRL